MPNHLSGAAPRLPSSKAPRPPMTLVAAERSTPAAIVKAGRKPPSGWCEPSSPRRRRNGAVLSRSAVLACAELETAMEAGCHGRQEIGPDVRRHHVASRSETFADQVEARAGELCDRHDQGQGRRDPP